MSELPDKAPDFKTEQWRDLEMERFKSQFGTATSKIASLFDDGGPEDVVQEWYDPWKEGAYFIQGRTRVGLSLLVYNLTWSPITKVLDRYAILLNRGLKGNGTGTKINLITEQLARDLGAKEIHMSAITNERWRRKLLAQGYHNDPDREAVVIKKL
jgi:hypothetical protein